MDLLRAGCWEEVEHHDPTKIDSMMTEIRAMAITMATGLRTMAIKIMGIKGTLNLHKDIRKP